MRLTAKKELTQLGAVSHDESQAAPQTGTSAEQGGGSHAVRWYCAQTLPNLEHRALHRLSIQGFRAWLPQIATGPLETTVLRVMFPGYLFVAFDIDHDQWRPICSTFGVRRLFGSHPERPTPVRVGVIEALQSRGRAGDGVYDDRIASPSLGGLTLRLTAGPFHGFEGVCAMSTDDRVRVMLTMFGREQVVEAWRADVVVVP